MFAFRAMAIDIFSHIASLRKEVGSYSFSDEINYLLDDREVVVERFLKNKAKSKKVLDKLPEGVKRRSISTGVNYKVFYAAVHKGEDKRHFFGLHKTPEKAYQAYREGKMELKYGKAI